jgi:hypothetical protein
LSVLKSREAAVLACVVRSFVWFGSLLDADRAGGALG